MTEDDLLTLITLAIAEDSDGGQPAFRVTARGEIDMATAPNLAKTLNDLIDGGATVVVFDASAVEFMDSTGLRALIGAGNRLSENGGRLFVEGMSGAVQQVLEISGVIDRYRRD